MIPNGTHKQGAFRAAFLANPGLCDPPTIAVAKFIPSSLVAHLLRNKKNAAIGVKYRPGDAITNMEGAVHSLVTPVVSALMQGDYEFAGTHVVPWFGSRDGLMLARPVIVSCLVQPDFEFDNVMVDLIKLEKSALEGRDLNSTEIPTADAKRDPTVRKEWDLALKQHILKYTVGSLPPKFSVSPEESTRLELVESSGERLSLEMLRQIMRIQLRGELKAITQLAPQGFVYTWDPPAIFAHYLSATALNRLWVDAMADAVGGTSCKLIAFNNYDDRYVIPALRNRISIPIMAKSALFPETLEMPESVRGCAVVIHNNSDGFGQNIETEAAYGSLDGAIGSSSSTSASVLRTRPDLLDRILLE